jgi:GntR family transcriptional regulator, transcriptional repressor for pyruvate dehydrogenase complex
MSTFEADIEPFSRRAAVERAHRYITRLIDLKEYNPGDRLPAAAKLSEEIGVSRPVVLEALAILASNGRVSVGPGAAGSRVLGTDGPHQAARIAWLTENAETIANMAVVRQIIEPGIARLLAERGMSAAYVRKTGAVLAKLDEVTPEDRDRMLALDSEFHGLLGAATEMPSLAEISNTCRMWVAPAFDMIRWSASERPKQSQKEHYAILDAIQAKDADAAWSAALAHMAASTPHIEALMRKFASAPGAKKARKRS